VTTILVTGGAGYIGSHTCKALRRAGYLPVTYDNLSRGNSEAVQWGPLEIGDLADRARLRAVIARHRPTAVVHFAALAYVGESNEDPAAYYGNNVGGTAALLEVMREAGTRHIVFSSTCAIYGAPKTIPISEQCPEAPINPYGASKMTCERMLRECSVAFSLTFMALRYFNAAGADPEGEIGECHVPETHVIPLLLDAADGAGTFTIFGNDYPTADGTCVRDYIHVSDLADAHVAALRLLLDGAESAAVNLGTGYGWSLRDLIDSICRITHRDITVRVGPRRPGDPPVLIADASRARKLLCWQPRYSSLDIQVAHAWAWRQGLSRTWKRMREPTAPA
jgi:UDP-arabinose 4-epimerase